MFAIPTKKNIPPKIHLSADKKPNQLIIGGRNLLALFPLGMNYQYVCIPDYSPVYNINGLLYTTISIYCFHTQVTSTDNRWRACQGVDFYCKFAWAVTFPLQWSNIRALTSQSDTLLQRGGKKSTIQSTCF